MDRVITNMNHVGNIIDLSEFSYDKYELCVKISGNLYTLEIHKNILYTNIIFYKKLNGKDIVSKYDVNAEMISIIVKNDTCLDKYFFTHIKQISKAQRLYNKFGKYFKGVM